ncbi:MAG: InlB B-repeat-containing protein [Nocardioides sp.]
MDPAVSKRELDRQKSAGVGLIRQYVWWDRIERSERVYDWSRMDQLVNDVSRRGMQILPTLLYPPEFYKSEPAGYAGPPYPPTDPQTMADFATVMVDRYGTGGTFWTGNVWCKPALPGLPPMCPETHTPITYWEVWNEPDYPSWWKGVPNAAEYFQLLKTVAPAIRAADPAAKVVLGALTNAGGGTTGGYLEQLYDLGAKDYFDVLSLNPYARDVGAMVAYVRGERAVATRHGDADKPIYITEYGWATGGVSSFIVTTQQCQAALLYAATMRLWDLRLELKIHAVAQFQWHDVPTTTTSWPHYAGVIDANDEAKPSFAAYKAAVAGEPAPPGMTLEACPEDRRSLDGRLQLLTVTKSGSGSGDVSSAPKGVRCGEENDCSQEFPPGTVVTLTATPEVGSAFTGWTGATCSGTTCTVTTDTAMDIGASFAVVATPGTYQQGKPPLAYTGVWKVSPDSEDSGGSSKVATTGPASVHMVFEGKGVSWVSRKTPTSGISRVLVDGLQVATVDGYSSSVRHQRTVFDSGTLEPGQHSIRVKYTGQKRAAAKDDKVIIDAFVVR